MVQRIPLTRCSNAWYQLGIYLSRELCRIVQGIHDTKDNDVADVMKKCEVPSDRIVTSANIVCEYRLLKSEPHSVRLTIGCDMLS